MADRGAQSGERSVAIYRVTHHLEGEDVRTVAIDLFADVMHYLHSVMVDPADVLRVAQRHVEVERAEEG